MNLNLGGAPLLKGARLTGSVGSTIQPASLYGRIVSYPAIWCISCKIKRSQNGFVWLFGDLNGSMICIF